MATGDLEHIKIHCACGAGLKVPPKAIGKKIKCPKCETVFVAEEEESPFSLSPLDTYDEDKVTEERARAPKAPQPPPPPASDKPGTPCPLCGKPIAAGAVMCVACGYDTRSGRRVSPTKITVSAAAKIAKGAGSFLLGCTLSGVGAVIGAAIWLGVGIVTKYEIGWIAWALGGLAGAGMALGYRQYNRRAGVTAAAIALGGIFLGKGAFFIFLLYAVTTGNTQDVTLQRSHLVLRLTNEELNKRGVWDPDEREKQWDSVQAETEKRIQKMKDAEVDRMVNSLQDEESARAEEFSEAGLLRSRLAWHEAEREAEAKGLNWTDPQREKFADKSERKLQLLPESQLKLREKELDEWQESGRFADPDYVHHRLVYEFIEEDLRAEPPAGMEELADLSVEEWDIPEKVFRKHYDIALEDAKELSFEERVAKLREVEGKRADDEIRNRLAYHRGELKADRDGISPNDFDARSALQKQLRKELDALSHDQLADESIKLDQWQENGKSSDSAYLRDRLVYAHADLEIETRRGDMARNDDQPYWIPSNEEWKKFHADAVAKVDTVPADQYAQQLRDVEAKQSQILAEQQQAEARAALKEVSAELTGIFFQSMLHPLYLLFVFLALSTAYRIGSHGFSKD